MELDIDTITPAIGILDTPKLAQHFQGKYFYALKMFFETVSCPWTKLHNAGNDSNYAL